LVIVDAATMAMTSSRLLKKSAEGALVFMFIP
jgi:hypothetical protein